MSARAVQRHVFDRMDHPGVQGFVVWGPMLGEEERSDAVEATRFLDDRRTTHFWTDDHALASRLAAVLELPDGELAWDTYLLYAPGQRWGEDGGIPEPSYVMHVGKSLPDDRRLHAPTLRRQVESMLAAEPAAGDGAGATTMDRQ